MAKFGKVLTYRDTEEAKNYIGKKCLLKNSLKWVEDDEYKDVDTETTSLKVLDEVTELNGYPFKSEGYHYQFCLPIIEDEEI